MLRASLSEAIAVLIFAAAMLVAASARAMEPSAADTDTIHQIVTDGQWLVQCTELPGRAPQLLILYPKESYAYAAKTLDFMYCHDLTHLVPLANNSAFFYSRKHGTGYFVHFSVKAPDLMVPGAFPGSATFAAWDSVTAVDGGKGLFFYSRSPAPGVPQAIYATVDVDWSCGEIPSSQPGSCLPPGPRVRFGRVATPYAGLSATWTDIVSFRVPEDGGTLLVFFDKDHPDRTLGYRIDPATGKLRYACQVGDFWGTFAGVYVSPNLRAFSYDGKLVVGIPRPEATASAIDLAPYVERKLTYRPSDPVGYFCFADR